MADIEKVLAGHINSFYLKKDLVKAALPFSGYIMLPSTQELSDKTILGEAQAFNSSDAHYFATLRWYLYHHFKHTVNYDPYTYHPLIRQYSSSMARQKRKHGTEIPSSDGIKSEITGLTYLEPAMLQRLLRPENISFKANDIWDKYNKELLKIGSQHELLKYFYVREISSRTLDTKSIKKFLVLFYFMTKDNEKLRKNNKMLCAELTLLISWLAEETMQVKAFIRIHNAQDNTLLQQLAHDIQENIMGHILNDAVNQADPAALNTLNSFIQEVKDTPHIPTPRTTAQFVQDQFVKLAKALPGKLGLIIDSLQQVVEIVAKSLKKMPHCPFQEPEAFVKIAHRNLNPTMSAKLQDPSDLLPGQLYSGS